MVTYPWYVKLLVSPLIGILVLLFLPNPTPVAFEVWEQQNLVMRLCMLLAGVLIPAGIAEAFFARLVFTESGIEKRTKFLKKQFGLYSEIEAVEYRPATIFQPAFLIITFSDLRTIKIVSGLANLQTVGTILVTYGNKLIMTTSKELKD
ncbi:MAG TPA: hypothetical protein VFZ22_05075 [Pyrinomonadaceae bacterium]|nr:hypothetical protein [Pyrinomonadaceae bacterium]